QMPAFYDEADIYLNSPEIDNMPISIIEAFAAGLPVVTTDAGGIPFIVRHGDNGRMVACGDAAAMAAEACALLTDPDGALAMARAGLSSDTAAPTATDWRAELRDGNGRPFADAAAALGEFRAKASARFFAGTADIAATLAAIRAVEPGAESRTIELAGAAAGGQHRLLGHDALDYGTPPDWHLDPVHGRRAPLAHWSEIPYLDE